MNVPRSVQDAEQTLNELAPNLNPEMWKRYNDEVIEAKRKTQQFVSRYTDRATNDAMTFARSSLERLCNIRDELDALAEAGASSGVPLADYSERFQRLYSEHRRAAESVQELARSAELLELIEDDPIAWADQTFHAKYPHMKPKFSF